MQLDSTRIAHAADLMGRAVMRAEAAVNLEVPWILGRRGATEQLRSMVGEAAQLTASAADELASLGAPFADAAAAARTFADVAEHTRGMQGVRNALQGTAWLRALEQLRFKAQTLDVVASGERAMADGGVVALRRFIGQQLEDVVGAQAGLRLLATRHAGELGEAHHYLAMLGTGGYLDANASRAKAALAGEFDEAWHNLMMKGAGTVDLHRLRELSTSRVRSLPGSEGRMPAWLEHGSQAGQHRMLTMLERADLWLRSSARDGDDVTRLVLEQLAVPHSELGKRRVSLAAAAEQLPEGLRVTLPMPPGAPSAAEMLNVSTHGLHVVHKPMIDAMYARLAAGRPTVLAEHVAMLRSTKPSIERTRRLALIGHEAPAAVLGDHAAHAPWARELLAPALSRKLRPSGAAAIEDAFDLVRRAGGSRERIIEQLERVVAEPVESFTREDAGRLIAATTALPAQLRPRMPEQLLTQLRSHFVELRPIPAPGSKAHRLLDDLSLALERERLAGDPATTRAAVTAELDQLLAAEDLDGPALRRLALLADLPAAQRPRMPWPDEEMWPSQMYLVRDEGRTFSRYLEEARITRAAERLEQEPGRTVEATLAELERLLATPEDALTAGKLRRLLTLADVQGPLATVEGRPAPRHAIQSSAKFGERNADLDAFAGLSENGRRDLDALRMGVERRRLVVDGVTSEQVGSELRALLRDPKRELEPHELRRISILQGLPDHMRPYRPEPYDPSFTSTVLLPWGASDIVMREASSLRLSIEAAQEFARNPRTREQLTDELALLLLSPARDLDDAAVRRAALISRAPEHMRPELPPRSDDGYDLARIHFEGLARSGHSEPVVDAARVVAVRNSGIGLDEFVAFARGPDGKVDLERLDQSMRRLVVGAGTEQLRRLGINDRMLLASALGSARDGKDKSVVDAAVREAHQLVQRLQPLDDADRLIIPQLREQLDRNLARIERRLGGGYMNYVDHAEHGAAVANADLLRLLDEARTAELAVADVMEVAATPAGNDVAAAARTAAERLEW